MKRVSSFLLPIILFANGTAAAKADPPVTKHDGNSNITVNARLPYGSPYTTYYVSSASGATTPVTVSSTHFASYEDDFGGTFTLSWYFRSGVVQEQVDSGSITVTLPPNQTWAYSKYLSGTCNLGAGHYQAVASSTLTYDGTVGPYAYETAPFDVYVGYAGH